MGGDAHRFNQSRRRFFVPQNRWSSENKEQSQAWLELCRVATEEDENQIKEIKESAYDTGCAQERSNKFLLFPLFLRDLILVLSIPYYHGRYRNK